MATRFFIFLILCLLVGEFSDSATSSCKLQFAVTNPYSEEAAQSLHQRLGMHFLEYLHRLELNLASSTSKMKRSGSPGYFHRLVSLYTELRAHLTELESLYFLTAEDDEEIRFEAEHEIFAIREMLSQYSERLMNEFAKNEDVVKDQIIIEIHPEGSGDTSEGFTRELYEMYLRFAKAKNWSVEILSEKRVPGSFGYQSVMFRIKGQNVLHYLRHEAGPHKRIGFNPGRKSENVYTTTANVLALPEPTPQAFKLDDKDLEFETMKASGAGGQHLQKTLSAVRVTHKPTGVSVRSEDERSQHQNRATALEILRARLYQRAQEEQTILENSVRRQQLGASKLKFSERRLYDHRTQLIVEKMTGLHANRLDAVLSGDLHESAELNRQMYIEAIIQRMIEELDHQAL